MINRTSRSIIEKKINARRPIIILGPGQAGKTSLIKDIVLHTNLEYEYYNCEDLIISEKLTKTTPTEILEGLGDKFFLIIDEAQRIPDISCILNAFSDQLKGPRLIIIGSSAFEPDGEIKESQANEKCELYLFPISWEELEEFSGMSGSRKQLESRLIFGMLPQVVSNPGKESGILQKLADNLPDMKNPGMAEIRKPANLRRLLEVLALQIGKELSLNQLSDLTRLDKNTVGRYIKLMEREYVIFKLRPLKRNQKYEIFNARKIYFLDNGIRNALISNFNPLNLRQDSEELWENFCLSERIKFTYYHQRLSNRYFWRTTSEKKVDYIEEYEGKLHGYQFKWHRNNKKLFSKTFRNAYAAASFDTITPANFTKFLSSAKVRYL